MPRTLIHAILLNLDPVEVISGGLRIEAGRIVAAGPDVKSSPGEETFDCHGAVVLPGLVNGHTHLYSALAAGMPPPPKSPQNFHEILKYVWWRLDRAHDAESIEMSGHIGALDALRCGTTTLIDHHASPDRIVGSLDQIEQGIDAVGLRGVLCYEVSERNGHAGSEAGLEENRRYLEKCRRRSDSRFGALVGAHAAFTLGDQALGDCVRLAEKYNTGLHIHVAEDPCDDAICRETYGAPLIERLRACDLLVGGGPATCQQRVGVTASSILAHGTHLNPTDAHELSAQVAALAHNPRSNMNNRVGHAPVEYMTHVLLGTDGMGADMFTEARFAWFKACDAAAGSSEETHSHLASKSVGESTTPRHATTPARVVEMLAHSARVAGMALGCTLGKLTPGAAADVVITDYVPATALTADNAAAHFIFAMGSQHVCHVIVDGQWVLRDRRATRCDASAIRREAVPISQRLWDRM